jgi:guanylate kinase
VIERRIVRATEEIREARWYDYIVINDRLDEAQELLSSIVTASRATTRRMLGQVAKMFDI